MRPPCLLEIDDAQCKLRSPRRYWREHNHDQGDRPTQGSSPPDSTSLDRRSSTPPIATPGTWTTASTVGRASRPVGNSIHCHPKAPPLSIWPSRQSQSCLALSMVFKGNRLVYRKMRLVTLKPSQPHVAPHRVSCMGCQQVDIISSERLQALSVPTQSPQ